MDYLLIFRKHAEDLHENKFLLHDESKLEKNKAGSIDLPIQIQERIPSAVLNYYKIFQSYERIWTYEKKKDKRGFINILPIGDPVERGKQPDQYGLTMFDFFVPEAGVGYYIANEGEKPNDELFLVILGEKPYGLNVDLEGYIQLLYMARGFAYWQMALLSFQNNTATGASEVADFKKWMPIVFPDFKWEEFVVLYEKVRII